MNRQITKSDLSGNTTLRQLLLDLDLIILLDANLQRKYGYLYYFKTEDKDDLYNLNYYDFNAFRDWMEEIKKTWRIEFNEGYTNYKIEFEEVDDDDSSIIRVTDIEIK